MYVLFGFSVFNADGFSYVFCFIDTLLYHGSVVASCCFCVWRELDTSIYQPLPPLINFCGGSRRGAVLTFSVRLPSIEVRLPADAGGARRPRL